MYDVLSEGVGFHDMINKFDRELSDVTEMLKKYGASFVAFWNSRNKNKIKSIRIFCSDKGNKTILISARKNSYDLSAVHVKISEIIGKKKYDEIFEEETIWTLKRGSVGTVIALLKNNFGLTFVEKMFDCTVKVSIKSESGFESLKTNKKVASVLDKVEKPGSISVTYPR